MNAEKNELLEEEIKLEFNMSRLYELYQQCFENDKDFWQQMAEEENNHALLLRTGEMLLDEESLPEDFLYNNLNELKAVNKKIEDAIAKYRGETPSREEAYNLAIELEEGAYEFHYQKMMTEKTNSEALQVFQKLNMDDKDHAERIKALL
ncbi:ferritin family protein [Candidatus Omnitrophota bacterium]